MPKIYVYVDGADLEEVEGPLLKEFQRFAQEWNVGTVKVINDRFPRTPDLGTDDLPDWNLGINIESQSIPRTKTEELLKFLSQLSSESGREFVVGGSHKENQPFEDWCFVGSDLQHRDIEFCVEQFL